MSLKEFESKHIYGDSHDDEIEKCINKSTNPNDTQKERNDIITDITTDDIVTVTNDNTN